MASVLVTGTSKGIGMATALVLGRAGHTVFATMRNPSRSPELAETAEKENLPIYVSTMDVDSDTSVSETIASIQANHGPIDVLVNNAGIERRGAIEELPISEFRAVMETNYFGALRCIQAVMPDMREHQRGCIINVTSVAGRISVSPLGSYAASKFALEALSEALAQEAKMFNVRVAIVQPGIIDTSMAWRITEPTEASPYPHTERMANLFSASLQTPASPTLVGQQILEIIETDNPQLRYPVGPDSHPFLDWRAGMSDEEWVDFGSSAEEAWYDRVERDFGLNARVKN